MILEYLLVYQERIVIQPQELFLDEVLRYLEPYRIQLKELFLGEFHIIYVNIPKRYDK